MVFGAEVKSAASHAQRPFEEFDALQYRLFYMVAMDQAYPSASHHLGPGQTQDVANWDSHVFGPEMPGRIPVGDTHTHRFVLQVPWALPRMLQPWQALLGDGCYLAGFKGQFPEVRSHLGLPGAHVTPVTQPVARSLAAGSILNHPCVGLPLGR